VAGQWFSLHTTVSSTNKTDRHNMTEILLKVALNIVQYEQQHIMTNHPNKYESYRTNNLREVAFTK
jgi:hypothetical protein